MHVNWNNAQSSFYRFGNCVLWTRQAVPFFVSVVRQFLEGVLRRVARVQLDPLPLCLLVHAHMKTHPALWGDNPRLTPLIHRWLPPRLTKVRVTSSSLTPFGWDMTSAGLFWSIIDCSVLHRSSPLGCSSFPSFLNTVSLVLVILFSCFHFLFSVLSLSVSFQFRYNSWPFHSASIYFQFPV